MNDEEQNDLLLLKARLESYLDELNRDIANFDPAGNDGHFAQLIKKATYYRDLLKRINQQLNDTTR